MKPWFRSLLLVVTLAAGIIAAAAQEDGTYTIGDTPVTILPLDVVTESAAQVLDLTDTSARVNFIGTEALACYLIYGTDETYGNVTNDPGMQAAAIVEHNPVMLNLEPDTEYFYRLQGVGEDGVMYVSEVYTFRTLPQQESSSENLLNPANGARLVDFSSIFGDGPFDGRWGIVNAVDDNQATAWSSDGDGDDAFFTVELDGTYRIDEIVYQTRAMGDGTAITQSFRVIDGAGQVFGPYELTTTEPQSFAVDMVADRLRFEVVESTGGNTGIVDVFAFGDPVE